MLTHNEASKDIFFAQRVERPILRLRSAQVPQVAAILLLPKN